MFLICGDICWEKVNTTWRLIVRYKSSFLGCVNLVQLVLSIIKQKNPELLSIRQTVLCSTAIAFILYPLLHCFKTEAVQT